MGYKSCPHKKKNYGGFACMGNQTQMSANVDAITGRCGAATWYIDIQSINQPINQSIIDQSIYFSR